MPNNFQNIPEELRILKQWVLWKYEDVGAAKPTKVPYSVKGYPADVNKPDTWSTFVEVFTVFKLGAYSGIGFVFTDMDPYSFIDLDDAEGDDAILQRHLKVYHEFDSYSEVSPSGKGLHIIVKGTVAAGRRRSKIEIYPSQRYATMTGNVYNNKTVINERQTLLTQLWEQMGSGPVAQSLYRGDEKENETDQVILQRATNAVNGDKFQQLYSGDWNNLYQSQSEADFALVDIIAFYTQNKNQIERIFKSSKLGKRDKANRKDYIGGMISRSFDRMLPNIDFDGMKNALELKLVKDAAVKEQQHTLPMELPLPNAAPDPVANLPPGLLGEIAQFIYQAAPRPVPEVALAASIGLMAGICGRAYNISGTGLNQYVLLLAMTGAGKEAAAEGIDKLMATIKMQVPTSTTFIGPGEISSGTAMIKHLANISQSFVSLLGEFGLRLQQLSSPHANGAEVSLRRMILDLYNKSGASRNLAASAYAKREDSTASIPSPAVSFIGESTPERFYGILNEDMIAEGLLPRFLLIEYKGNRPPLNEHHTQVVPSFSLIEKLAALVAQCETINHSNPRRVINVQSTPDATNMLHAFDKYADNRINNSSKDVIRQLWNRAHIKVLKLSATIAVGENMLEPIISAQAMEWAANLVQADIAALTERFEAGEIGGNSFEIKQGQEILRVIKDYITSPYDRVEKYLQFKSQPMHNDKVIPYSYLNKRLVAAAAFRNDRAGATIAMKRAIQNLIDADRMKELGKVWTNDKYGTSQRCFALADLSILD